MPNWVTNRLRIKGEPSDLERILATHLKTTDGDPQFDFNTIIPEPQTEAECPPAAIRKTSSSSEEDADRPWFDWYVFRNMFWGTKWNAHETQVCGEAKDGEIEIWFDTAWSPSVPIYLALSQMYPKCHIEGTYVEEQGPVYTGILSLTGGRVYKEEEPESESKRAYEIMFEMWGNDDAYEYDPETDNYKYVDPEDTMVLGEQEVKEDKEGN